MSTPTKERVNEILSMRSNDSRQGDMEMLGAYIQGLRAELDRLQAAPVVVPKLTQNDLSLSCEWTRARGFDEWPELETEETVANLNRILASRAAHTLGPGEVVDIAAIVHDGGLANVSEQNALIAVRMLTAKYWNNVGSEKERGDRVSDAMIRALSAQAKQGEAT